MTIYYFSKVLKEWRIWKTTESTPSCISILDWPNKGCCSTSSDVPAVITGLGCTAVWLWYNSKTSSREGGHCWNHKQHPSYIITVKQRDLVEMLLLCIQLQIMLKVRKVFPTQMKSIRRSKSPHNDWHCSVCVCVCIGLQTELWPVERTHRQCLARWRGNHWVVSRRRSVGGHLDFEQRTPLKPWWVRATHEHAAIGPFLS